MKFLYLIGIGCWVLLFSGCQYFNNPEENHTAVCKAIQNRMMFNGIDINPHTAWKESSETPKMEQSYQEENCDTGDA